MATQQHINDHDQPSVATAGQPRPSRSRRVGFLFNVSKRISKSSVSLSTSGSNEKRDVARQKSTWGILADKKTDEVPGTVLLLSPTRNEPLGYNQMETHREDIDTRSRRSHWEPETKKTSDGRIVLDPQPEDTPNDPLNWPAWRRDAALVSLGYYCMVGGGMTPILAAGFNDVATTYGVTYSDVALTTGLYMMGLGVGSVIFSPTAILWGKRPVYLVGAVLFVLSAVWCALAPSYAQLVIARIFQGIAVSPVECLPSATIAEIFFLHERAFRIGIYTLLLLGGKNLIPLVSAAVIQSLGWRWVFWIVGMCVGFGGVLLFFFVPETFWDRTPRPKRRRRASSWSRSRSQSRASFAFRKRDSQRPGHTRKTTDASQTQPEGATPTDEIDQIQPQSPSQLETPRIGPAKACVPTQPALAKLAEAKEFTPERSTQLMLDDTHIFDGSRPMNLSASPAARFQSEAGLPKLHNLNSPFYSELEKGDDYFAPQHAPTEEKPPGARTSEPTYDSALVGPDEHRVVSPADGARQPADATTNQPDPKLVHYTTGLRNAPAQPWLKTLKMYHGRISRTKWWRVACRPFVLFAYPSVLWSAMVYALSVGWLIVLSEAVAHVYRNRDTYNFTAIQSGLVYLSPFIGGVLGTAVAGKLSDVLVRFLARRNEGIYEPEFRLVMAIPITITTAIGLMGFGWSVEERDNFMVPTVFFGIISFGCCVGSTTSITFCVDSYRQFAGEALVTLNFSKNILHGLIWSLFFPSWLEHDGPKTVFVAIGGIQIACMLTTIPMYIYGKRARMWTVRKRMMERL